MGQLLYTYIMVGFNSDLNKNKKQHPSFEGWSEAEIEKYFSDLDDIEIAAIVRERLSTATEAISIEELAARFGIDFNSLNVPENDFKPSRPAGFRVND